MGKYFRLLLLLIFVVFTSSCSSANDIYIGQVAAGKATGAGCNDANGVTWFNDPSNWGAPVGKIGPGTTVHLCGTISSPLTIQGGGVQGRPITILFENNARLSAPNWGDKAAAITSNHKDNLTIDGGTNGVIEATSNGTGLATTRDEGGIVLIDCSNCIVRNLTISNIYVHAVDRADENGENARGIYVANGSNITLSNNTVHDARWCISYDTSLPGNSNVAIFGNTIYNCDHGIRIGDGNANATVSGVSIYANEIYDGYVWDDNAVAFHHDGIHAYSVASGSVISGLRIYDNYIHGNWGTNVNSFIFEEANSGGTEDNILTFNNLVIDNSTVGHAGLGLVMVDGGGASILQNTIIGNGISITSAGIDINGKGDTVEGNIIANLSTATYLHPGATSVALWDYNDYYNVKSLDNMTFAQWQAYCRGGVCHLDKHSGYGNPNLSATYTPTLGSKLLLQKTPNLSSLSIPQLDLDKAGNRRPSEPTLWTIGAFALTP